MEKWHHEDISNKIDKIYWKGVKRDEDNLEKEKKIRREKTLQKVIMKMIWMHLSYSIINEFRKVKIVI